MSEATTRPGPSADPPPDYEPLPSWSEGKPPNANTAPPQGSGRADPAAGATSNGASNSGGSNNGRPRSEGQRDPLHRLDGYSTTSEFLSWAEQVRRDHMRRHDAYLQHAAILEEGIKKTSHWPWQLNKLAVARRASRPLRQNAGSEQDSARRISATVRVLVQMKDAPKARARGFDATR